MIIVKKKQCVKEKNPFKDKQHKSFLPRKTESIDTIRE
jgi:hypothetical protein